MIRLATTDDIPHMLKMGKRLHDESVYSVLDWDNEKMTELLEMAIASDNFLTLVSGKGYFVVFYGRGAGGARIYQAIQEMGRREGSEDDQPRNQYGDEQANKQVV